MNFAKNRFASVAVGALVFAILAAACTSTESDDESSGASRDDITTAMAAFPDAKIVSVDDDGVPTFITGNLGAVPAIKMEATDVNPVLPALSPVFRAAAKGLTLKNTHKDSLGDVHYRFGQTKGGLNVIGAELIVHVRKGTVYAANGNVRDDLALPGSSKISGETAIANARAASTHVKTNLAARVQGDLALFQNGAKLHLVQQIEVTGVDAEGTPVRDIVLVDSIDGSIAQRMPQIMTARNREMHDSAHSSSTPGALKRIEGGAPDSDVIINDNYDRLGTTYDCYKQMFGRDSYDNNGAKLESSVHYSTNYVNAYWNGTQMVYGDGDNVNASNLAESMDVTAHELTHAVTASTSNLTYSGQSGGLNEGMSDIFGATCEYFQGGRTTVNPLIWAIGHDIWTPNGPADDGLRYMNDPKKDGKSLDYAPDYAGQDVHYTSGVPNLAYYLLAMGGTHPRGKTTINVPGIGIEKAAQVFFRANTTLFTASTNYAAAKTACEQAATQLGYSADDIASVTAAWQAVGVGTTTGGGGGSSSSSSGATSSSGSSGTSGSTTSSTSSGGSSGSTGTCKHSTCSTGTKLPTKCDPCVAEICAADSYCCATKWDATCVSEVASICGHSCN